MTLCLALSYGGRESIVVGRPGAVRAGGPRRAPPEDITEERFAGSAADRGLPQLDLLVRTSGEERLSNFLLWEVGLRGALLHRHLLAGLRARTSSYQALESYRGRERRFGRTREQIRSAG